MSMISSYIQSLRPSSLKPWPLGNSNKDISLWGVNHDPKDSKELPLYAPGTQVLIKVWKDGSPKAQPAPMEGSLSCNTFYPLQQSRY